MRYGVISLGMARSSVKGVQRTMKMLVIRPALQ
jgi:hypothetical protein